MDKENSLILPASSHPPGQHSSVPRGNSPAWSTFPCWEKNRVSDNFPQPFNALHKWPALVSLPPLYGVDEKLRELRTKKSSNYQYQPRGRSDHNCLCIALQKTPTAFAAAEANNQHSRPKPPADCAVVSPQVFTFADSRGLTPAPPHSTPTRPAQMNATTNTLSLRIHANSQPWPLWLAMYIAPAQAPAAAQVPGASPDSCQWTTLTHTPTPNPCSNTSVYFQPKIHSPALTAVHVPVGSHCSHMRAHWQPVLSKLPVCPQLAPTLAIGPCTYHWTCLPAVNSHNLHTINFGHHFCLPQSLTTGLAEM